MISLGNVFTVVTEDFDEVWVICRSVGELTELLKKDNVYHVPDLSPLPELFKWYRTQVKNDAWTNDAFQEHYVPEFLESMKAQRPQALLDQLVEESKKKDIVLVCFCENEAICHRSIVAGILFNRGAEISCHEEYRKYRV